MTAATHDPATPARASGGRPRSADADRRILEATFRILTDQGYASMSIEAVAAAAGVGKPTIYRRYASKRELAAAAMQAMTRIELPVDLTDMRQGLVALLKAGRETVIGSRVLTMMGTLLVEERREPELMAVFRERLVRPRRAMILSVLQDGQRAGRLRAGVDLEAVLDMLIGAQFARYLSGEPIDDAWIERLVDTIWPAIAP